MTLASLSKSGNIPLCNDWFIIRERVTDRHEDNCFKSLTDILSFPALHFGLKVEIIRRTSSGDTRVKENRELV